MSEKTVIINAKEYNVYATVSDANDYFAAVFGSEWTQISEDQKPKLLVTATRLIDRKEYQGEKIDENQPLKFPRIIAGEQTDDNLLTQACCEVAMSVYFDGGYSSTSNADIKNVQSVSLGDSSISFKEGASIETSESSIIDDFLGDYLMGGVQVVL